MNTTITIEPGDHALVVRLDRPAARNAIDEAMVAALHDVCATLERRPQVLILTGGNGIFASGADLRELLVRNEHDALAGINRTLFDRIDRLPLPTIAAVSGPAIGGGAELAYACDFRLGDARATFSNPEVLLGVLPASGACWRLRELVGLPLAKEMLLAGRRLDAGEALAAGMLNELVADGELMTAAAALAARIGRGAPLALRLTKAALQAPPGAHPAIDDASQAALFQHPERATRIQAQLDRAKH